MSVEIIEQRTRNSKSFQNDDGSVTVRQSTLPMHYLDEDGKWQDVDGSIKEEVAHFFVNKGVYTSTLPLDIKNEIKYETEIGSGVNFQWLNVSSSNGVLNSEENKVVYSNAWNGVDIEYTPIEDRMKNYIVIKEPIEMDTLSVKITDKNGQAGRAKSVMKNTIGSDGKPDPEEKYLHEIAIDGIRIPRLFGFCDDGTEISIVHKFDEETGILDLKLYLPENPSYPIVIDPTVGQTVVYDENLTFVSIPFDAKKMLSAKIRFTRRTAYETVERSVYADSGMINGTAQVYVPTVPNGYTGTYSRSYHYMHNKSGSTTTMRLYYKYYYNSYENVTSYQNIANDSYWMELSNKSSYIPNALATSYSNYSGASYPSQSEAYSYYNESIRHDSYYPNVRVGRWIDGEARWLNPKFDGTSSPSTSQDYALVLPEGIPSPWYDIPDFDVHTKYIRHYDGDEIAGHYIEMEYTYTTTGGLYVKNAGSFVTPQKIWIKDGGVWKEKNMLSVKQGEQWTYPYIKARSTLHTDSFEYDTATLAKNYMYFDYQNSGDGKLNKFSGAGISTSSSLPIPASNGSNALRIAEIGNMDAYVFTRDRFILKPNVYISFKFMKTSRSSKTAGQPNADETGIYFLVGNNPSATYGLRIYLNTGTFTIMKAFENAQMTELASKTISGYNTSATNSTLYDKWIEVTFSWENSGYIQAQINFPTYGYYSTYVYDSSISVGWSGYGFGKTDLKNNNSEVLFDDFKITNMY